MRANMRYLEGGIQSRKGEGKEEGSSGLGVLWLSGEPKRKCNTALASVSRKTPPFTLTVSFSPCTKCCEIQVFMPAQEQQTPGFTETHGTNSFLFEGSFLFTKGGFSNAVLDHRGEKHRHGIIRGFLKLYKAIKQYSEINIVLVLFSFVTSSIITIENNS